jgi:MinD superfamily P-loop ATPase
MIISVASGKGGTGKTTIATCLAVSLPGPVQLLDCDVEAPNAHLFLKPEITETQPVNAPVPSIDMSRCSFCKKCMDICRFSALAVTKANVLVFENHCHSCGGCLAICPENAVNLTFRSIGDIEIGRKDAIGFAHGKLGIGQVMAPPIIRHVRNQATTKGKNTITIIDAPPGTSCPVIAAVNKTDFVILVTEPTPFGLHDLKLAVETVKTLNIPHGIFINRAGIGDDSVQTYAQKEGIPILMTLPFDKKMAQAYSNGSILADEIPGLKSEFISMFNAIRSIVAKEAVA